MPFSLTLSDSLRQAGWKVKIHDFERLEPPHVTVYRRMRSWRLSLRSGDFLDLGDRWSQIDEGVKAAIQSGWTGLQMEWDRMHPDNPVAI